MNYKKIIGSYGENIAKEYLIKKGYKIIELNKQISHQEIDIIASIKGIIIFIEVKTRTNNDFGSSIEAINKNKIRNIKRAMMTYSNIKKIDIDSTRFDVVTVDINKELKTAKIKHYINLF